MKNKYLFERIQPILLITGVISGAILGLIFKKEIGILKPIGTIFINLLFTSVVPMVFISVTYSIANINSIKRLWKILFYMIIIFIITGFIAGTFMSIIVGILKPFSNIQIPLEQFDNFNKPILSEQIIKILTVNDFRDLLSIKNITPLIVFSIFVGFSVKFSGKKNEYFLNFLKDANEILTKLISLIMYLAPVGLCAYIAVLVGELGEKLVTGYIQACIIYFSSALLYILLFFPIYTYLSAGIEGLKAIKYLFPPAITAFSTQSSLASLSLNLEASRKIGVSDDIRNITIPLGTTLHMDGTCLANIIKIYFIFNVLDLNFSGIDMWIIAIIISTFSGAAAGAIPGGGWISEMIIAAVYGLPIEAVPIMGTIGILVDSMATMINAVGDNISAMIVSRIIEGKNWMKKNI